MNADGIADRPGRAEARGGLMSASGTAVLIKAQGFGDFIVATPQSSSPVEIAQTCHWLCKDNG